MKTTTTVCENHERLALFWAGDDAELAEENRQQYLTERKPVVLAEDGATYVACTCRAVR